MPTPWEIAEAWYSEEEVGHSIQRMFSNYINQSDALMDLIPTNVQSQEFAHWLTHQYRLAMAKGIQMGRDGSEDNQR